MATINAVPAGGPSQAAVGGGPPPPAGAASAGGGLLSILPSNQQIVQRGKNDDLGLVILQAVSATNAHLPNGRAGLNVAPVMKLLWNETGTGGLDGRWLPWTGTTSRAQRNLRERITALIVHHSQYTDAYPSPLQTLARRIFDEQHAHNLEVNQRRETEQARTQQRQSTNNQREGALGALPPGRGTGVPTMQSASQMLRVQAQQAAGLLAQNPRSQNNSGTCRYHHWFVLVSLFHDIS